MLRPTTPRACLDSVRHAALTSFVAALQRHAQHVLAPVHVFEIPPKVMHGLYAGAFATRDGQLHRCVVSFLRRDALSEGLTMFANILKWTDLSRVDGRIELGANTGDCLRYFLANTDTAADAAESEQASRSNFAAWLQHGAGLPGKRQLRCLEGEDGGQVLCLSTRRTHYLTRADGRAGRTPGAAQAAFSLRKLTNIPSTHPLHRDIMGEWLQESRVLDEKEPSGPAHGSDPQHPRG